MKYAKSDKSNNNVVFAALEKIVPLRKFKKVFDCGRIDIQFHELVD